jgi:hypothetical protein
MRRSSLAGAILTAKLFLLISAQLNTARAQHSLTLKDSVPAITTNGEASAEVVRVFFVAFDLFDKALHIAHTSAANSRCSAMASAV